MFKCSGGYLETVIGEAHEQEGIPTKIVTLKISNAMNHY